MTSNEKVDVLIVGSGASGAAVAWSLADTRMRILCLEQGDWVRSTDFPTNGRDWEARRFGDFDISPNRRGRDTDYPVNDDASIMKVANFNGVGGGTVIYTAHWPRLHPSDFRVKSLDGVADDWPVDYWTLERFYEENDRMMGVSGLAGDPGVPPRHPPMPPIPMGKTGTLYARAMNRLGWHWWPSDTTVATMDYEGRARCINLGHCTPACAQGAKASPLNTVVPALGRHDNFELRTLANVIKINLDSSGKRAVGVTYIDARGNEVFQEAGIVVLGAYCFNNVRLMLLSGIGTPYDPTTGKGTVGRNYAYQQGGSVEVFFDDKEFNPFIGGGMVNTSIDEFNGDIIDRGPLGFIGGAYMDVSARGSNPIKGKPVPHGTPRWGSEWKKAVSYNFRRTLNIAIHATSLSFKQNYLDLDPTYKDAFGQPLLRMTFDWPDNDLRMMKYMTEQATEIGKALKGSKLGNKGKGNHFTIQGYQSTHNAGGAVMGSDPSTSVVNKYLQSWVVPNLFVVGGSAFPQQPANGPTETIGMGQ